MELPQFDAVKRSDVWRLFVVMNRMPLDSGLFPAILQDPVQIFGSAASIARIRIMEGQNSFRGLMLQTA